MLLTLERDKFLIDNSLNNLILSHFINDFLSDYLSETVSETSPDKTLDFIETLLNSANDYSKGISTPTTFLNSIDTFNMVISSINSEKLFNNSLEENIRIIINSINNYKKGEISEEEFSLLKGFLESFIENLKQNNKPNIEGNFFDW